MRKRFEFLLAAGLGVLAVVALFVPKASENSEHRISLQGRAASSGVFQGEATLRNVTKKDLAYTIQPSAYSKYPRTRTLGVGAVDRISTELPVEISYDNGSRPNTTTIFPGRPYSFRYDENGLVKVYPGSHGRDDAADLAPYVPTPPAVVDRMLEMASIVPDDVVYDIGCGDGRMVIAAAKKFRVRGVGIDIDPGLIERCRENAKNEGVEGLARFICADATKSRFAEATVLALYLLPESLEALRPLFERDLRPGTRLVSHDYRFPGWEARLAGEAACPDGKGREHKIFLYVVPGGRWP